MPGPEEFGGVVRGGGRDEEVEGAEDIEFEVGEGGRGEGAEEVGEILGAWVALGEGEADAEGGGGVAGRGKVLGVAGEGDALLAARTAEGEGDGGAAEAGVAGDGEVEGAVEEEFAGGGFKVLAEGVEGVELDALRRAGTEGGEGGAGDAGVLGGAGDGEAAFGQENGEVRNEHGRPPCGVMMIKLYRGLNNLSRGVK